ncbi:MAG: hypothetical protein MUC87_14905 [Bacteroidia bacterium]|jgi:hypothetical protein|nr:hypothetical protein [Bacteroidia bacterium]
MPDYKIIERISLLTETERKEFRKVIRNNGNQQEQKLFEILDQMLSSGKMAEKEKLYKKVYGTAWKPEKDYLLRNLFRHLTDEVEFFLRHKVTDARHEQRKEYLILVRMLDAGQFGNYEKRHQELLAKAEKDADIDFMADLHELHGDYLKRKKLISIAHCEMAEQNVERYWQLRQKATMHELASALVYIGFVQRSKKVLNAEPASLNCKFQFPPEDNVVQFFRAMQRIYECTQLDLVRAAEEAMGILKQVHSNRINKDAAELNLQTQIALGYLLAGKHNESCRSWEKALQLPAIKTYTQLPDLLYNYTSVLLKDGQYVKAISVISSNRKKLEGTAVEHRLHIQMAVSQLYMGNTTAALRTMNALSNPAHDNDYLYGRCVWLCCFLAKGDIDMAANEMLNLKQSRIYKRSGGDYYQTIAAFFNNALTQLNNQSNRQKLASTIEEKINTDKSFDILPVQWLKQWLCSN